MRLFKQCVLLCTCLLFTACSTSLPQTNPSAVDSHTRESRAATAEFQSSEPIEICSFNIQFLGHYRNRDNEALADLIADYDIVVIQEMTDPPVAGQFPNGEAYHPDEQSAAFLDAMEERGFRFLMSEEDTGTNDDIHRSGPATEWWIVFYKEDVVVPADDLWSGFLAEDRSNHPDYERVPYAFAFRSVDESVDFVLVSVHLKPGDSRKDQRRRAHELTAIASWIDGHDDDGERDFIILGDMNIKDQAELANATPEGFVSLNDEVRPTNTNVNGPKPYAHVMYRPSDSREVDEDFDLVVIDLIESMRDYWDEEAPYPGDPYNHDRFRTRYSDHHPIVFQILRQVEDDD